MRVLFYLLLLLLPEVVLASEPPAKAVAPAPLSLQEKLKARVLASPQRQRSSLIFDLPLTYNQRVSYWIAYFQTKGKSWFGEWLEKSTRYLPMIQKELRSVGLPQDLVYMVMIESGFEANAKSHADAVGPWQFISSTGTRYGLHVNYWLDERRDMKKSTLAAIHYLSDLYKEFGSWYLVAASYNMGETGLRRQINKFSTRDFWVLSQKGALPSETVDYVPKILAAMMIAKSPGVYGFDRLSKLDPVDYDVVQAPGGLDLNSLADHLGVTHKALRDLNAELVTGYIPPQIEKHLIRVPRGSVALATDFMARSTKR
jgi:membrane-bound lytic murein transglycosylase D